MNKVKVSCLWLIFLLSNSSYDVVYGFFFLLLMSRGQIIFIFKELCISCLIDYVDVYDGLLLFILGDLLLVQFFYKFGLFCGWYGVELKFVIVILGNMVVFIMVNLGFNVWFKSFSVKFSVKKCLGFCDGNYKCVMFFCGEECVCLEGWIGDNCDQVVCLNNCSLLLGQGYCNFVSRK